MSPPFCCAHNRLPGSRPAATDSQWLALLPFGPASHPAAVKVETGYRCSAGVACNKLLAKLVSGLHKPDDQTVLLPPEAASFVAPLPVRALPGVGELVVGAWVPVGSMMLSQQHWRAVPPPHSPACLLLLGWQATSWRGSWGGWASALLRTCDACRSRSWCSGLGSGWGPGSTWPAGAR